MSLPGRCIICTSAFTPTTVFALPCGHTFHEQCIGEWLKTPDRGCPNCRRKCHAKDVTRIFFDIGSLNDTFNVTTQESREEALRAKNQVLQAHLNHVTAEASKAKKDLSVQNICAELETLKILFANEEEAARKATQKLELIAAEVLKVRSMAARLKGLMTLVANEEKAARKAARELELNKAQVSQVRSKLEELKSLITHVAREGKAVRKATQELESNNAKVSQVRSMLHDINETKRENKVLKQQLGASDFYKDLFRGNKPVDAIETYINARGDPDTGKFMELQSRALTAEKKKRRKMAEELELKNKRISELEIEITQGHLHCMCVNSTNQRGFEGKKEVHDRHQIQHRHRFGIKIHIKRH